MTLQQALSKKFKKATNAIMRKEPEEEETEEEQEEYDTTEEEKQLIETMGLQAEFKETQSALFTAQINFENFKALFKRNPRISKSGDKGYMENAKFGKYEMSVKVKKENVRELERYVIMANDSFGMKSYIKIEMDGSAVAYFNYDEEAIAAADKAKQEKKKR